MICLRLVAHTIKNPPAMQETWVRSPGEGSGYSLQCSCLENPMDRGAWQATVPGVTKSRTWPERLTLSQKRGLSGTWCHTLVVVALIIFGMMISARFIHCKALDFFTIIFPRRRYFETSISLRLLKLSLILAFICRSWQCCSDGNLFPSHLYLCFSRFIFLL